jgi:hypothetical protein
MKFLRILPETCARTWCLFSSSTLNNAFGSVSTTTAITSIASSFDKQSPSIESTPRGADQLHLLSLEPVSWASDSPPWHRPAIFQPDTLEQTAEGTRTICKSTPNQCFLKPPTPNPTQLYRSDNWMGLPSGSFPSHRQNCSPTRTLPNFAPNPTSLSRTAATSFA